VGSATHVPKKIVLHHIFEAFYFEESAVRLYQTRIAILLCFGASKDFGHVTCGHYHGILTLTI